MVAKPGRPRHCGVLLVAPRLCFVFRGHVSKKQRNIEAYVGLGQALWPPQRPRAASGEHGWHRDAGPCLRRAGGERPRGSCSVSVHQPGWWGASQAALQITSNPSAASGLGIGVLAMYFSSGTRPTRPGFGSAVITCIHSL